MGMIQTAVGPMDFGDPRLPTRFWDKCAPIPDAGCWLWTGDATPGGYGRVKIAGRNQMAHRVSLAARDGAIGNGLDVDHLCRVRSCVNPAHLEAVTRTENLRRSGAWSGKNMRKTHCPRGHILAGDNLCAKYSRRGKRACLTCVRAQDAAAHRAARRRGK